MFGSGWALRGRGTLVPVLFDGAEMPPPHALPETISALSDRHGLEVRTASFDADIQPLLRELLEHGALKVERTYSRSAQDYEGTRWSYPDPPLPVRPAQLSDQDLELALKAMIPNWTRVESPLPEDPNRRRGEIRREFRFDSLMDVIRFIDGGMT